MAKAGNLKLNFVAKSIGIHFFGFKDIFRCYRDNEKLKIHFGRMEEFNVPFPTLGTLSSGNVDGKTCEKIGDRTLLRQKAAPSETVVSALSSLLTLLIFVLCLSG